MTPELPESLYSDICSEIAYVETSLEQNKFSGLMKKKILQCLNDLYTLKGMIEKL